MRAAGEAMQGRPGAVLLLRRQLPCPSAWVDGMNVALKPGLVHRITAFVVPRRSRRYKALQDWLRSNNRAANATHTSCCCLRRSCSGEASCAGGAGAAAAAALRVRFTAAVLVVSSVFSSAAGAACGDWTLAGRLIVTLVFAGLPPAVDSSLTGVFAPRPLLVDTILIALPTQQRARSSKSAH